MIRWALGTLLLVMAATPAAGQSAGADSPSDVNTIWAISKAVLLDPTTYAPAAIAGTATKLDWNTSQVLFANGFVERNPRFTVSGRSDDIPISFEAGNQRIFSDTLAIACVSAMHNFASQIVERALLAKHPEHRKLIATIAW